MAKIATMALLAILAAYAVVSVRSQMAEYQDSPSKLSSYSGSQPGSVRDRRETIEPTEEEWTELEERAAPAPSKRWFGLRRQWNKKKAWFQSRWKKFKDWLKEKGKREIAYAYAGSQPGSVRDRREIIEPTEEEWIEQGERAAPAPSKRWFGFRRRKWNEKKAWIKKKWNGVKDWLKEKVKKLTGKREMTYA